MGTQYGYLPPKSEDFRIVFREGAPPVPDRFTIDDVTLLLLSELSPELPANKKSRGKLFVPLCDGAFLKHHIRFSFLIFLCEIFH